MYYQPQQYASSFVQNRNNYMDQQFQQQQYQFSGIKGRPVASIDEARASMIDFDGSIFYFPDTANKRIYTKQINLDGTSSLKIYTLLEQPLEQQQNTTLELPDNVVLKDEFDKTVSVLVQEIENLKGVIKEYESKPSNGNNAKDYKF